MNLEPTLPPGPAAAEATAQRNPTLRVTSSPRLPSPAAEEGRRRIGASALGFELTIGALFLLSGAAALLYQVSWQRLLFSSFGVDIESVTIVVSTFMLGLGAGALAGGWIADRFPTRLIACFAISELVIGLFGLLSADAIAAAARVFVDAPRVVLAGVHFLLLLLPTSMMGATLPLLTVEATRRHGGVGRSIGRLYFVNTLGAASGALFLGAGGFVLLGLRDVITIAAGINLLVVVVVLALLGRRT